MANTKIPVELSSTPGIVDNSNATAITINSSENVGIGTSSPASRLTYSGSFDATSAGSKPSLTGAGSYGGGIGFIDTNVAGMYTDSSGGNLKFFTNQSGTDTAASKVAMTIDSSGNVGIGATTIDDGNLQIGDANSPFNIAIAGTRAKFGYASDNAIVQGGTSKGIAFCVGNNTLGSGEAMRINSSGNVGIGTTSPSAFLHTEGTSIGTESYAKFSTGSAAGDQILTVKSGSSRDHMALQVNSGSGAVDDLALNPDGGNVGIGTSSPSEKLTIQSGNLNFMGGTNDAQYIKFGDTGDDDIGNIFYYHGNNNMVFTTNASEAMRIDSSGRVMLGTTSNSGVSNNADNLIVGDNTSSTEQGITLCSALASGIRWNDGADAGLIEYIHSSNTMTFYTSGSERMRIDSSGRLLVGTTNSNPHLFTSGKGFAINQGTFGIDAACDDIVGIFNRTDADGTIVEFKKSGTVVGSIASKDGDMALGTGDTGLRFIDGSDAITPHNTSTNAGRDNAIDLGSSGSRFDDIYATNGTIQTSDRNEKQDIEELTDAETRVAVAAKGLLRKFRWQSAVASKGDEARIHFGIIAQDLQDAFTAEGLDASDYAMFISSTWTDDDGVEQTRLGVRYSELLAFIIAAI